MPDSDYNQSIGKGNGGKKMELKITTCPICGNRYFREDYPQCPVCAGIIKRQGETEAMTDRDFTMNGSETLPLNTPDTERRVQAETEMDFGHTMPPDYNPLKADVRQRTVPVRDQKENVSPNSFQETKPPYDREQGGQTQPVWYDDPPRPAPAPYPWPNPQPTPRKERKIPVVGWLVAINGEHRGEDYQIRGYNTMIGRDRGNKIVLTGDECVSRTNCSIRYYADNRRFFIYNAPEASNPVYVNKEPLHEHAELHAYDVIIVGRTELVFIPLCGQSFDWSEAGACN